MSWFLISGCAARQRTFVPPQDPAAMGEAAFLHYLATVPVVNVDEGLRAVLQLAEPNGTHADFESRHAELCRRGLVRERWKLEPNQVLDKGTLGFMLRKLCELPPGATEQLVGIPLGIGDRRYALRTCVFEEIMPYGTEHDAVTGGELLTALTAAEIRFVYPEP